MTKTPKNSKTLSKERYNQYAQGYVNSKTHASGFDLERLLTLAQPQKDWTVLDIATGGGHTALRFAPFVKQVIASDLTPNMLEAAKAHIIEKGVTNVDFQLADAENLPFEANHFDLVTCRIAPHHFPDVFKFVQESYRVLKAGGIFLVQDHVLPDSEKDGRYVDAFEKLRDPSHNRAFAEYEWTGTFLDAGFTVEHTEQLTKQHEFIPWAERQGCSPDVIQRLEVLLAQAPPVAKAWMQGRAIGTPEATFINHHLIIKGSKPE